MKILIHFIFLFIFIIPGFSQKVPINEFVSQIYVHGLPYEEANAYGSESLPALYEMLCDPTYEDYRFNVISTIAMIRDSSSTQQLLDYFYQLDGEISHPSFVSVMSFFQAMGYNAQEGSHQALDFLINWTRVDQWKKSRHCDFRYEVYKGERMGAVLGRFAIQAIGFSGKDRGLKRLQELRLKYPENNNSTFNWHDDIEGAIELFHTIEEENGTSY